MVTDAAQRTSNGPEDLVKPAEWFGELEANKNYYKKRALAAEERNRHLHSELSIYRRLLIQAEAIVEYVSMGRGYIGAGPYPDATARRVNAEIKEALGRE